MIPSVLNSGEGEKKLELDAATLHDALKLVIEQMGDSFARKVLDDPTSDKIVPRSLINMYINGKNAEFSGGLDAILKDSDELYLLPAVAGGSDELSSRELDRYSRQVMLESIGYEGQIRLRNSTVCIVGAGGLGHPIAARLAGMGVGHIRLVDRDVIELSNLHRQALFVESDVGKIKVELVAERLKQMNSDITIEPIAMSIGDVNAASVVDGCDVVIDALDSVNARYALNRACVDKNIPFVSGAAVGVSGQALCILPGKTACYHCVFPALDEDAMPTCSIEGVNPAVLSVIGGIQTAEAVKILTGKTPALAGRMLYVDIESMDFVTTKTLRADECPVCGTERVVVSTDGGITIEELCGRNRGKRTFSLMPPQTFELDTAAVSASASRLGYNVTESTKLGMSVVSNGVSVSFMSRGSAVIVGANDDAEAVRVYRELLGQ